MDSVTGSMSKAGWAATAAIVAAASYVGYAAVAWVRYGRRKHPKREDETYRLLDRFLPNYEIFEQHSVRVAAPPPITYRAACKLELESSPVVRTIFRVRERVLGGHPTAIPQDPGLIAQCKAMGWGVLAEIPSELVVMGAVTQPWAPSVVFRAVPPEEFASFNEPGYIKIAWTIQVEPDGNRHSIFCTETRAVATDAEARSKFRLYWAAFSAGIVLIRRIGCRLVRRMAEAAVRTDSTPNTAYEGVA